MAGPGPDRFELVDGPPAVEHHATPRRASPGRRRLVPALAVVAVIVAAVMTFGHLTGSPRPTGAPSPSTAPAKADAAPVCDTMPPSCRLQLTRAWRASATRVLRERLDPDGQRFAGYNFGIDPRYDSDGFWADRRGRLGLDLVPTRQGSAEIFLQIASEPAFAIPCGQLTRLPCNPHVARGMRTTPLGSAPARASAAGFEVQYASEDGDVVTLVARPAHAGDTLDFSAVELTDAVQDARLRLPAF